MHKVFKYKFLAQRIVFSLAIAQLVNCAYLTVFFLENHYLPQPFFKDKNDTFMDFFHPLYWATNEGRYTEWGSIYPPLVFLFLKLINFIFIDHQDFRDSFQIRHEFPALIQFYLVGSFFSLGAIFITPLYKNYSSFLRGCFFVIYALSVPALFAIERGNIIIFCLPLLAIAFVSRGWTPLIMLAILINIKPYFILLLIAYLYKNEYLLFLRAGILSGIIFFVTGIALDNNFLLFFNSLINFSGGVFPFHPDSLIGLTSSITAFSYVEEWLQANALFEPLWRLDLATLISFAIRKINLILELAIFIGLYFKRMDFKIEEIFSIICVIITTLSFSFGGYIIVIYAAAAPFFMSWKHRSMIFFFMSLLFLPIDFLPIISKSFDLAVLYYSGEARLITFELGAGSLLRPVLNEILLILMLREILSRKLMSGEINRILPASESYYGNLSRA